MAREEILAIFRCTFGKFKTPQFLFWDYLTFSWTWFVMTIIYYYRASPTLGRPILTLSDGGMHSSEIKTHSFRDPLWVEQFFERAFILSFTCVFTRYWWGFHTCDIGSKIGRNFSWKRRWIIINKIAFSEIISTHCERRAYSTGERWTQQNLLLHNCEFMFEKSALKGIDSI